jgi:peptidylamidoglycolate lyase
LRLDPILPRLLRGCVAFSSAILLAGWLGGSALKPGPGPVRRSPEWQLVRDWPRLPAGVRLGQVSGVDIDRKGHVMLFHRAGRTFDPTATEPIAAPTVLELEPESGTLIASWGAGLFLVPHSLTVDTKDNVWVTDVGRHQVLKFSHDGKLLLEVGERRVAGWDAKHFDKPTDVAIAADGSFYVSDGYGNARVAHFTAAGVFIGEWGAKGSAPGQFALPHGIALGRDGRVYVADRENHRLQVFDPAGKPLGAWPDGASTARVFDVTVSPSGAIYLARDIGPDAVRVLSADLKELSVIPAPADSSLMATPHAIVAPNDTVIYVADAGAGRLRKFVRR